MQSSPSPAFVPPTSPSPPPKHSLATMLAAAAIALAVIAVAINFVIPGPTGPTGPAGGTTPAASTLWADVNGNGSLAGARGVSSSYLVAAGEYQLNFSQSVANCAYFASGSTQNNTTYAPPVFVGVAPAHGADDLLVDVHNTVSAATNEGFDIVVMCGGDLWAVVGASGALVRGADAVSVSVEGTGNYIVTFNQQVVNCSFIATLVAPSSGGAIPVGTVTVAGEAGGVDGVWVATYNATGVATSYAFALTAVCSIPNWAVVSSGGILVRGSSTGATGGAGSYDVFFNQAVMNCAYIGSTGEPASSDVYPGSIVTFAGENNYAYGVFAATFNTTTGGAMAASFHLAVFC